MDEFKERNQEMWRLRFIEGWRLREIAKWAKISRQRVQQILGNTGKEFLGEWTRQKINSGAYQLPPNVEELDNFKGSKRVWLKEWGKHRHKAKGGNAAFAQRFEELASQILSEYGIPNKLMPFRHPFDIKTDLGIRIDVKVTNMEISKLPSQRADHPTYQLPEMKSGKDCDFFFVFIPDSNELCGYTYFIIPSFEFHHLARGSRPRIPYPPLSHKPSKFHKYHKKIELIKG